MNRMNERISIVIVVLTLLVFSSLPAAAQAPQDSSPGHRLTPVVLFPGWGGTRLEVRVHNQTVAPECPRSGTFEYTFFPAAPQHRVQPGVPGQAVDACVRLRPAEASGGQGKTGVAGL